MLEFAVAEGVALLGKIGYDVWKRWLDHKSPGAAVVSNGSPTYAQDPMAIPSMLPHRGAVLAPSLLTVSFVPQDDQAAEYIFEEQPCLLVVVDNDHPEVDGFVVAGRVVDIHEILLPPGRYDVSAFVFDDETLETLSGIGSHEDLALWSGFDAELDLAIGVVADELTTALVHDDLGMIQFDTGDAFALMATVVKLGRGESNDIVIDDPGVSSLHVILGLTHRGWAIEDCGSLNGTYVNGQRVGLAYLTEDDVVTVGTRRFVVSP